MIGIIGLLPIDLRSSSMPMMNINRLIWLRKLRCQGLLEKNGKLPENKRQYRWSQNDPGYTISPITAG